MDEVIFEEFTRKEELLMPKDELNRVWVLRKVLTPLSPSEGMELLLSKMGKTKTNAEFLAAMAAGKS
jgi:transcription termination factor Rho